jgi:ABC-type antimicrobial peptide transport system permease subunit
MTTAIKTVWLSTAFVLAFIVMVWANIPIDFVMAMFAVGLVLIPYMVAQVLKEPLTTRKTFSDWYEDFPKQG